MIQPRSDSSDEPSEDDRSKAASPLTARIKRWIFGKPQDLRDRSLFRHISLIAILAWVGLGADGLSSSCYGPAEAYINLGQHRYLAVFLALATMLTVAVISLCYSYIIEEFPAGGGGYLVASKLLGKPAGVVSGCALLVDYVLTISISIAAGGEALFGFVGAGWDSWKLPLEIAVIVVLILLNLRGVRESVIALLPVFALFLLTHLVLIVGILVLNVAHANELVAEVVGGVRSGLADPQLGALGMAGLLLHAYSLGAGTYTGIEAVSNSVPVMREPRVATAKRTMLLMAVSLAMTAGGLVLAYLLLDAKPVAGKTMNHVVTELFVAELGGQGSWLGHGFVVLTLFSEAVLLVVAAQAGFIDGPRVLANMARDAWMPRWLANLSERLTMHNGILLIGTAAIGAVIFTGGRVGTLVIMYSINVFLTFSLSMIGMTRHYWQVWRTGDDPRLRSSERLPHGTAARYLRRLALFACGSLLCLAILLVTVFEKFEEGAWRTLVATGFCIVVSALIHWHYEGITRSLRELDDQLAELPHHAPEPTGAREPAADQPIAVILVGRYGALGIHTLLNALRLTPGYFQGVVFVSVGEVDSGVFKGIRQLDALRRHTDESLGKYVEHARGLGLPATSYMAVGTDLVAELEALCHTINTDFPNAVFFAGKLVFQTDRWYHHWLHHETEFAVQRRLQWAGIPLVILPTCVR